MQYNVIKSRYIDWIKPNAKTSWKASRSSGPSVGPPSVEPLSVELVSIRRYKSCFVTLILCDVAGCRHGQTVRTDPCSCAVLTLTTSQLDASWNRSTTSLIDQFPAAATQPSTCISLINYWSISTLFVSATVTSLPIAVGDSSALVRWLLWDLLRSIVSQGVRANH